MARKVRKLSIRKTKRKLPKGVVHVQATLNNTIVTITDVKGEVISWSSAGACGFRGAKKATPFAAQTAAENAVGQALQQGMREAEITVNGPGSGRETAIRAIRTAGLGITVLKDVTPIAHNGCRPPKKRRV